MVRSRVGRISLWMVCLLVVALSLKTVIQGAQIGNPEMVYHLETRSLALYTHAAASSVAMILFAVQATTVMRGSTRAQHRRLGQACVAAICTGGAAGAVLALGSEERYGLFGAIGFFAGSLAWIGAGCAALVFAQRRNIAAHRTWTAISAALLAGAVSFRIELMLFRHGLNLSYEEATALAAWTCWVLNVAALAWIYRASLSAGRVRFS